MVHSAINTKILFEKPQRPIQNCLTFHNLIVAASTQHDQNIMIRDDPIHNIHFKT